MKRLLRLSSTSITTLMLTLFALSTSAFAVPTIGKPAPNFSATDATGKSHQLSDYKGKYVVLEWTNHECPFTVKHYKSGNMQALQKTYTDKDVVWLSVISSAKGKQGYVSPQQAQELSSSRNAHPSAVLLDESGQLGHLYGAQTTPHMYIITPEGTLAYNGAIDSVRSADTADIKGATNYVSQALDALLAGNTVATPLSKPYGCSIKY